MAPFKRPDRKKVAIAGVAVLAVFAITAGTLIASEPDPSELPGYTAPSPLTVTVPGDLDGDNKVTAAEKKEKETAKIVAVDLTNNLLPPAAAKDVISMVVTPAGQDWWEFISSMGSMRAYRSFDGAAPKNVNWYAMTWARSVKPIKGTTVKTYAALHVAFPDGDQALTWAGSVTSMGYSAVALRDNVVTIVPLGLNPYTEPFPQKLNKISDVKQTTGYWSIDYAKKIEFEAADTPEPEAYRTFWDEFGFGDATWEAASRDPGRWVGTINGWDGDDANFKRAVDGLVTAGTDGPVSGDGENSGAMSPVVDAFFAMDDGTPEQLFNRGSGVKTAGNRIMTPIEPLPEKWDFLLSIGDGFTGSMTATGDMFADAPLRNTVHWIIGDAMTIEFRDATELVEPTLPSPTPSILPEDEVEGGLTEAPKGPQKGEFGPTTKPRN